MKFHFIILLVLLFRLGFAQADSSKAVIFFKPKDAIIYLDGQKIVAKQALVKISVGTHSIKAWAPKYKLFTDSFYVKTKQNKFYSKKLVYSDEYKDYRAKKRFRVLTYTIPGILALGFSAIYYKKNIDFDQRINQTYNEALELQVKYNNSFSPQEFETNYVDYYNKVNNYKELQTAQKKSKTQGIVISSVLAATAITAFIIQIVQKKLSYQEVPLLSRITPGFNPIKKQICLSVNLY